MIDGLNVSQTAAYHRLDQLTDELANILVILSWSGYGHLDDIEECLRAKMRDDDQPDPPLPVPPCLKR
jgi:hypothetical protein